MPGRLADGNAAPAVLERDPPRQHDRVVSRLDPRSGDATRLTISTLDEGRPGSFRAAVPDPRARRGESRGVVLDQDPPQATGTVWL
jgi:hypothetical protein